MPALTLTHVPATKVLQMDRDSKKFCDNIAMESCIVFGCGVDVCMCVFISHSLCVFWHEPNYNNQFSFHRNYFNIETAKFCVKCWKRVSLERRIWNENERVRIKLVLHVSAQTWRWGLVEREKKKHIRNHCKSKNQPRPRWSKINHATNYSFAPPCTHN